MAFDVLTDDGLRNACQATERNSPRDEWRNNVTKYLSNIADSSLTPEDFTSEAFQRLLWIDNPIVRAEQTEKTHGKTVEDMVSKKAFRDDFLKLYSEVFKDWRKPPRTDDVPVDTLSQFARQTLELLTTFCKYKPSFFLYRAFAALFPAAFTTIATTKIRALMKQMSIDDLRGGSADPEKVVRRHRLVLDRLKTVIGSADSSDFSAVARRMTLPWRLLEFLDGEVRRQSSEVNGLQKPDGGEEEERSTSVRVPEFGKIEERLKGAGHFPDDLCRQLHLGLWANDRRHFAILTGISGSGKTLLARKYAEALTGAEESRLVRVVPVQPGWMDPSFLLGYPNPLKDGFYERTEFLKLLLSAKDNPGLPHVAILDEMNLSHPEQYLAPVLSAMETGNPLELHGRDGDFDGVPGFIPYPSNLVLIGTVNMDETTMGLSDKVLDRAFTLEFWEIDVDGWPGWGSCGLPEDRTDQVKRALKDLMEALKPARLHFGYRVIEEVVAFLVQHQKQTPERHFTAAFNHVVHAKVLPKLRGDDSQRIRNAFDECKKALAKHNLEECARKVEELISDLNSTGSARFWR